ncbi:hypothetical protein K7X08_003526 [Anisodus acutangulus]|uniref:protein-serine/threonine phosphatase n=1 Tax=Anisodus acutangulus TaxID=402998 RepID=A0A9Q1RGL5_9SOLA|nr:hypothetical protein K7X08_003526 [Anisodus acutangulus]
MSCTVALSNSPVFSPSRVPSPSSPSPSSPSSPLRILRIQKAPLSNLIRASSTTSDCSSSSTVLKRKRPTRLDLPVLGSMSFGNFPVTTPSGVAGLVEVEGDGYYVCCKRGRKGVMEDRHSALVNIQGDSKQGVFGIFDGHGGVKAAEFAAENLNKNIMDEVGNTTDDKIGEAVKNGYLKTDSEFLNQEVRGGSCCVTALIQKGNLVVSNAGDCRAVVSRGGIAEALTSDHRPSRQDEKDRIEALGGYVDSCHGVWRIQGSLAVSRSIGDQYLKQWVTAEPETRILGLKPELEFLVLASDGLWDTVSNQEAVDIARPLCTDISTQQPLSACRKLIDLSVSRGSLDDISVMIVQLGQFC